MTAGAVLVAMGTLAVLNAMGFAAGSGRLCLGLLISALATQPSAATGATAGALGLLIGLPFLLGDILEPLPTTEDPTMDTSSTAWVETGGMRAEIPTAMTSCSS